MIKFPAPKVPKIQRYGATRSKASKIAAKQRTKAFLAKAARGSLDAVTAAMAAPAGAPSPDGRTANGAEIEIKSAGGASDHGLQLAGMRAVVRGDPINAEALSALEQRQLEIEEQRTYEERFENSLEFPEGGLPSNLPHDA